MSPHLTGALLAIAVAAAQTDADKGRGSAASVTLDQLSSPGAARTTAADRAGEVDVAQPARLPRAALVTSSEVSSRADGRSLATTSLDGDDRCDPSAGRDRTDLCRRRIEARADQYTRPRAAPVTPEARLLLLTNPAGMAARAEPGSRSTAGLNDPNGPAEQLAGALRDRAASDPAAAPTGQAADNGALPSNVSPVVVIRPK